ncbi:MAG TPA: NAD(P)/FAD-dependent oxidoreductase [bacterium]|nr:NAD(P)/FAD-dependent oxidoreductase [bacterium]
MENLAVSRTETVVIGAGPAGLAAAACLTRAGVPLVILEREQRLGASWHRHYERLHLHTDKNRSELPFLRYPGDYPRYPSRAQVIEYLESHARQFGVRPRFGQRVVSARRVEGSWQTRTADALYVSKTLVIATGYNGELYVPTWPGQESFAGEIVHSSAYGNGDPYRGKAVLVVGFGNSGGEIAIDLWEHGARATLAVRSPVNILPRDLLGIPILAIAIPLNRLPPRLADILTVPILRLVFGNLSGLGLRRSRYGPFAQIRRKARIPLIDVGTVGLIRRGHVQVRPGIERFTRDGVVFAGGQETRFDAVVMATGYRPALSFLDEASAVTDAHGNPFASGREVLPGLYFCGFHVSPTGMLREIAMEAKRIAREIARSYTGAPGVPPEVARAPRASGPEPRSP